MCRNGAGRTRSQNRLTVNLLLERKQRVIEMNPVLTNTLLHRVEEQHLELPSVDADLRNRVTGFETSCLTDDCVSIPVIVVQLTCFDAGGGQGRKKAKVAENEDGRRLDVDADSERGECTTCFENVDVGVSVGVEM